MQLTNVFSVPRRIMEEVCVIFLAAHRCRLTNSLLPVLLEWYRLLRDLPLAGNLAAEG